MKKEGLDKYQSFNSLAREPLMLGVPVIVLLLCGSGILITGFVGLMALGVKGLIFPLIIVAFLIYLRIKTEEDSRAIEDIKWDIKGLFYRIKSRSRIVSFSSLDETPIRRKKDVAEWFKNNTD